MAWASPNARWSPPLEAVCERENLKKALRRVKANKGSPGVDGMTAWGGGTVGTDEDIVFAKPDDRVLDSTEAVNAERKQFH